MVVVLECARHGSRHSSPLNLDRQSQVTSLRYQRVALLGIPWHFWCIFVVLDLSVKLLPACLQCGLPCYRIMAIRKLALLPAFFSQLFVTLTILILSRFPHLKLVSPLLDWLTSP